MSSPLIIYGVVGLLALAAVVIAFVNWILLASVSSRMADLDGEVAKKTSEFDLLRREMHHAATQPPPPAAEAPDVPPSPGPVLEEDAGKIQIFRNVREDYVPDIHVAGGAAAQPQAVDPSQEQTYTPVEAASPEDTRMEPVNLDGNAPASTPEYAPVESAVQPADEQPPAAAAEEQPVPEPVEQQPAAAPAAAEMEGDVMDIVSADEPAPAPPAEMEFTLPLYSSAKKDADFLAVWKTLAHRLSQQPGTLVHLDLNNVLFVYDEELQYLEQMVDMAAKYESQITFVGCTSDVARVIGSRPRLAACLSRL